MMTKENYGCFIGLAITFVNMIIIVFSSKEDQSYVDFITDRNKYTNQEIIDYYKTDFEEWRTAYFEVAQAFDEIDTDSAVAYSIKKPNHKLFTVHKKDITNKYPHFKEVMQKWFSDEKLYPIYLWEVRAENRVLFWDARETKINLNGDMTHYIYTRKTEPELLQYFQGHKIVDYVPNDRCCGWLYRLEKNWYVLSPDQWFMPDIWYRIYRSLYY
ncbi:MAG: hypothetical protein IKQ46_00955 [Bacteroidales bacterium]|nr:hypothetical protein [Bacteroidales bacterium]